MSWIFVDDQLDEAQTFADQLGSGVQAVRVLVMSPRDARDALLGRVEAPTGVLMDVDLSNADGERGSGPGLAQDLRVKQKAGELREFPIARFAALAPIRINVKGDPGSDDLFDLKVQKEELRVDLVSIQRRLTGLEHVYEALTTHDANDPQTVRKLVGLPESEFERWCHQGFRDRLSSSLQVATHVAAGSFMRGFLVPTGLLLDERVLSYRLGIDPESSRTAWRKLLDRLPFAYSGIASEQFPRWWSRGLEDWWAEITDDAKPLAGLTIDQRVLALARAMNLDLLPLIMPPDSPGRRPWRLCAISLEAEPARFFPVDPSEGVRMTPRADLPPWTDPLHAALGPALQERLDLRLNRSDLARLERRHR
jgi:hypothetical protein